MIALTTMFLKSKQIGVVLAVSLAMMTTTAFAADYQPDIREFTAENSLSFPGNPAFGISNGGTIEFWVTPDWKSDLGYDPVLIMSVGETSYGYVFSLLGDKTGIAMQSGDYHKSLPFDFSNNQLHHVAIVNLGEAVLIMIDGRVIGQFENTLEMKPVNELWLGNSNTKAQPFVGALGGLRFWETVLERETLINFALKDVQDKNEPHPYLMFLTGQSDLKNNNIDFYDSIGLESILLPSESLKE